MARAKQLEIEGTDRAAIPEIEEAAEDYRALRDERMALTEKETAAQAALCAKMQAHNISSYRYEDPTGVMRRVVLDNKIKAKVAKIKSSGGGGDDDGGGDSADN